jgi:GDP-4-dehydro-6-deoxy-D-mannose reductase
MRVLITGAGGFVGHYLTQYLTAVEPSWDLLTPDHEILNICNPEQIKTYLTHHRPDAIIHLAAQSSVAQSFKDPLNTYNTNVLGTAQLIEAAWESVPNARVLFVSSAEVYGGSEPVLTEASPLFPGNPYAASKAAAEMALIATGRSRAQTIIRARPFNHTGPGQSDLFVLGAFVSQLAKIKLGLLPPILKVGNLSAKRDFLDVRDVVKAYYLLLTSGVSGEVYNIASGEAVAIQELLDILRRVCDVPVTLEQDPARMRPSDVPTLCGEPSKIKRLGFEMGYSLTQTIQDAFDFEVQRLQNL